ncbi:hypothetical protein COB18_01730 [Candidatus Kaiserbacteria bacterium]|nr:MAG: hypothetical protein COB18_01730 [Candidatus Kaiserbacteria bacterium]
MLYTRVMVRPRTTPEFNKRYAMLNAEQKKAVDTVEGPVMVIAGPGTGKTQILTLRIANILKQTDAEPSSILALTFTEAGVAAMRKRLVSMIGPDGYRVGIYTFHAFCNTTIQRFPDDFPRLISSDAITDIDRVLLMREILAEKEHLEQLRPFYDNFAYVRDCLSAISELKREYVDPEAFATLVDLSEKDFLKREDLYNEKGAYKGKMKTEHQKTQKRIERNKELIEIYEQYEKLMREKKLYDYEDMIGVVVSRLEEDRDVLQRLQEEYQYVLADEHQDANTAQNRLLELLVDFHATPNLFIVGDEKQAIFRFQGASLENFLYFKKKYPEALLVTLKNSYRSGQKILDVAHSVITASGENIERTELMSHAAIENEAVELRTFSNDDLEALWVARDIEKHIAEGVPAQEIAVLYRTNADAGYIARALERERIPYTVESNRNILDDPEIAQFILLLRAVADFGNEEILARALHARFLGFQPLDVFKILKHRARNRKPLYDSIYSEKTLKEITVSEPKAISVFAKRLTKWAQSGHNDPVIDVFNTVLDESGFLTMILNSTRSVEMLEKLSGLARDVEQLAAGNRDYTLKDLIHHLDLLDEYHISITKSSGGKNAGVRLMTGHRSKGLEFDYVYLVGAWDTHWGNKRSMSIFSLPLQSEDVQDNADERRLFYVSLTRARQAVLVSYGRVAQSGKERLPTQFIEEMHEGIKEDISTDEFEATITPDVFLKKIPEAVHLSVADTDYLKDLFVEQGLSVTAINNYLTCPWSYFYSNLIRIPKIPNKHMVLGTVVHKALNTFFDGKIGTKEVLLNAFNDALTRSALSGPTYQEIEERGGEALSGWFDAYEGKWFTEVKNEYKVDTVVSLSLEELPQLRVRGELDKVEIHSDGVTVIDYKTGKPKSRNHLLGNTKAKDSGNYFRQLVFYKMLLDLDGRFVMKRGAIDFIQPKDNGKYIFEEFDITGADVDVLIKEIQKISTEILTMSFWEERCADHKKGDCEYCALRDAMQ